MRGVRQSMINSRKQCQLASDDVSSSAVAMDGSAGSLAPGCGNEKPLPGNGLVDLAQEQSSVVGDRRGRVSWADGVSDRKDTVGPFDANDQLRDSIPEISGLWWNEHEDGKEIREPSSDFE